MGDLVEQHPSHLDVAEDVSPFAEAQIGGADDAGAFVERALQMEQRRPARGTEGQASKFIEDDEIGMCEPIGDVAGLSLGLLSPNSLFLSYFSDDSLGR